MLIIMGATSGIGLEVAPVFCVQGYRKLWSALA